MGLAVITGASSGMGLATTELFLERGWTVVAVDVVPLQVSSPNLLTATASVTDRAKVESELARLISGKRVDVVANIAGVYPPTTLATYTDEVFHRVFDVNVLGVLNVTAACRPYLAPGSAVVNFASVDAFTVSPGQLVYGASKAAVVMLTKELALELAPERVRVNGIAPGWVDTPGNAATGRMAEAAKSIPLGRVAQPREIAEWVWLLGDPKTAGFMSGETVVLSGADVMR